MRFRQLEVETMCPDRALPAMWKTKVKTIMVLVTTVVASGGGLLAQQPVAPKSASPFAVAGANSKPADSAEMAKTEAQLAKLRELVRPKPGEYATNIAKIGWERDPWEAAVKAAREGKPVIAYGPGMVGVPCGYG